MRQFLPAVLLGGILFTACYQRRTSPREPFVLQGHVRDCSTGAPFAGAAISITANDPNNGILSVGNNNAGSATTDGQGRFSVTPYAYDNTIKFNLRISSLGFETVLIGVNKSDILASGASLFVLDSVCLRP